MAAPRSSRSAGVVSQLSEAPTSALVPRAGGSRAQERTQSPAPEPRKRGTEVPFAPGQARTPSPAGDPGDRPRQQERAQTSGPCPECGHYGPRIVLCYSPDCLHEQTQHTIRKDGSRGGCSVSTGKNATPCPCRSFTPRSKETTS